MRIFLAIGFIVVSGLLVGCSSSESELYVQERATDKTIMVPSGLSATAKGIKNAFKKAGWKTFVSGGSAETSGSGGTYTNLNTKIKYPARYSVWAKSRVYDLCINFDDAISYDISIVDNVSGEEVAALAGRECEGAIENKITETLKSFL